MKPKTPTKVVNKEILERINFLAAASKEAGKKSEMIDLAQFYGNQADLTAKKSIVRLKPKHVFCKKCKSPLIPPLCAKVTVEQNYILYTCNICGESRRVYKEPKEKKDKIPHSAFLQDFTKNSPVLIKETHN